MGLGGYLAGRTEADHLTPYFLVTIPHEALLYSAVVTLICLFVFGYFKSNVTGQPPLSGAVKVMLIGTLAAAAAFGVARPGSFS